MGASDSLLHLSRHRLTARQYHRMGEVGVLAPDARTELIDGEVIDMASIGTRHASAVKRLVARMTEAVGMRAVVSVQDPLGLGQHNEPQPDLMLLAPRADFYASAHPTPADVWLLIEVADTTLRYDTEIKLPLYARHGVREVWVFDLVACVLQRHRQPMGERYAHGELFAQPERIELPTPPGGAIELGGLLLPPAQPA